MPTFQHPVYLFGLLLIVPMALLFIFVTAWKKKMRKQLGDEELVNALTKNYSSFHFSLKFLAKLLAILLCVAATANLRLPKAATGGSRQGIDVMVAVDVSNSMLAQDVKPNRLERAKQVVNKLIDQFTNNRMGLVIFAGQAYLQMPLTPDLFAGKMYVANLSPLLVPLQGTRVADALRLCNTSLDTREKKHKAIVLISDGEGHDDNTEEAIKLMKDNGIVVFTVGIGAPEGTPLFDPATNEYKKDANGNVVISKLNDKTLQDIATQTQGKYYHFDNADELANNLAVEIGQMEKKNIGGGLARDYTPYFQWFLLAALLLLIIETIIPERKMKWI